MVLVPAASTVHRLGVVRVNCIGGDLYAAPLCNGSGTCRSPTKTQECGSYACLNDACRTSCTSNVHCAAACVAIRRLLPALLRSSRGEGCRATASVRVAVC